MSNLSDAFDKHWKFINALFKAGKHSSIYNRDMRFDQLNYTKFGLLTSAVLMGAAESAVDFRPFWAVCNKPFASLALQTAQEMWKLEEGQHLAVKDSPTAAICFAIIAGSIQYAAIGNHPISEFPIAFYKNIEFFEKMSAKNSDLVFAQITSRRPMGAKPTGCLVLISAGVLTTVAGYLLC